MSWVICAAILGWLVGSGAAVSLTVRFRKRLAQREEKIKLLSAENEKLSVALLEPPRKTDMDKLIDAIESDMSITQMRSRKHDSSDVNNKFIGLCPLVTYVFNNGLIEVRELVDNPGRWTIDLLYKGTLVAGLTPDHRRRLREMLPHKIAQAALASLGG